MDLVSNNPQTLTCHKTQRNKPVDHISHQVVPGLLFLLWWFTVSSKDFIFALFFFSTYEVHTISFQPFLVWAFKIVVDSWEFSILLLYILSDDWLIFMISGSNEQLQQQLEYTLLKPDCHSWWISKMQWDTLEERYVIKFCFKLGKNAATETYGMLQTAFGPSCRNRASVFEWHKWVSVTMLRF